MITNEEFQAIQEGIAFGRLPRTIIEVRGGERRTFLHNFCTSDIATLHDGRGCETFFTTVQGKTICHALLLCDTECIYILTDPGIGEQLLPHLDKYVIRDDVEFKDRSQEMQVFLVAGPKATEQLGEGLDEPLQHVMSQTVPNTRIARVPFAKHGFFALAPNEISEMLEEPLKTMAQPLSPDAIEWLRISAGFPSSGRDVTPDNLPQEINRNKQAVNFEKGCYLGQETVARLDALGHVNKLLTRLEIDSADVPPNNTELQLDGKKVGHITSAIASPEGQNSIGLGIVRVTAIESGEPLTCEIGATSSIAVKVLR